MEELYWITTLGNIGLVCSIFATFGLMAAAVFTVCYLCNDEYKTERKALHKKSLIWTWMISLIMLFGAIFIPSTKELYLIYGVGSTIDYLKENPTAQNLPDKYIKVLDKIADDQLKEKDNDN